MRRLVKLISIIFLGASVLFGVVAEPTSSLNDGYNYLFTQNAQLEVLKKNTDKSLILNPGESLIFVHNNNPLENTINLEYSKFMMGGICASCGGSGF